ncbi:MAG: hypothetical protein EBQ75_02245 [Actinobacteria bacterium]|nr:hypothetical protein [Actinomycetota bacterium]
MTGLLALSTHTNVAIGETSSLFSASSTSATSQFTGATFTPKVAPVITPTITARSVTLAWTEVKSAKSVAYTVTRTGPVGTSTQVCTGANLPTVSQGTVRCTDTTATSGVSYTYSQQPFLDIANSTPWSLPASTSSSSVSAPRLSYIDSGPDASSTGPAVTVPYPASVELGDLLILIAICGVNKAPATPTGWNQIVSRGFGLIECLFTGGMESRGRLPGAELGSAIKRLWNERPHSQLRTISRQPRQPRCRDERRRQRNRHRFGDAHTIP